MAANGGSVSPVAPPAALTLEPAPARVAAAPIGLVVSLGVLNLLDVVTTRMVLDRGGDEGNPLMAPLAESVVATVLLKVLALAVIAVIVLRWARSSRVRRMLGVVNLWYAFVVGWNLVMLLRL